MKKKILILNGSSSEIMLIEAAKRLGFYVITTGIKPLIGHGYADEYYPADYSNHEEILTLAKTLKIDAICANANDFGLLTAIYVAERLGLPGSRDNYETSCVFHQKDLFKSFAVKNGFLTPNSVSFNDVGEALSYIEAVDFPVIVKPVDLSGGAGVSQPACFEERKKAVVSAFERSKIKRIVVEEYIPGAQYDFHTIVIDKKVVLYSASNEFSYKNPYRVNCLTIPADHSREISEFLKHEIERMARLLDVADGPLWVQYRIKDGYPYIIEACRRCGGNNMIDLVSRGFQTDFGEWVVRLETGMPYNRFATPPVQKKCQGYQCLAPGKNGRIKGVYIADKLKAHIFKEYHWWHEDDEVKNYLFEQWGIILFEYETQEEMMVAVKTINDDVRLLVE